MIISISLLIVSICINIYFLFTLKNNRRIIKDLYGKYKTMESKKKSVEVRTGHAVEKLVPFMDNFAYTTQNLHFMGMPIDYLHFGEDKITFIEVKSGKSRLSAKQKKIKKLINEKKVDWDEIRIKTS